MNIAVIGTGYVGLVAGACLAKLGHTVCCVDIDSARIETLNAGGIPIFESGLDELIKEGVNAGRLSFTAEYNDDVRAAKVVLITVATPTSADGIRADTSALFHAVEQVGNTISDYTLVVIKSTIPIGTHVRVSEQLQRICGQESFDIAINPEFLREGNGVQDFLNPDRIIVGTSNEKSRGIMDELYRDFKERSINVFHTDMGNAELIKYVSNSILAARITFINEVADLCQILGLNIKDVVEGVGLDHRIGNNFMQAGPGFGGSCFPKDSLELLSVSWANNSPLTILQAVLEANQRRQASLIRKIIDTMDSMKNKTVGILGVTFKENTDDMRNSFALSLIPALQAKEAKIKAYDPKGMKKASELLQGVDWCPDACAAGKGSDLLIIHTGWKEFQNLDWQRMQKEMAYPLVYDLRNICDPAAMLDLGFDYHSIGRPPVHQSAPPPPLQA